MTAVDVLLPVCDGAAWLGPQLRSLLAQTAPPARVLVHDDASRDGTRELLAGFAGDIVLTTNDGPRLGTARALDRLAAQATAPVVALCDQDDVWAPGKLARAVAALDAGALLVGHDAGLIGPDGARLPGDGVLARFGGAPGRWTEDRELALRALVRPFLPGWTLAYRRQALPAFPLPGAVGGPGAALQHDAWLVALAAATGTVEVLPDRLGDYRVHPGQQIGLAPPVPPPAQAFAARREAAALLAARVGHLPGGRELAALDAHLARRAAIRGRPRARRLRPVLVELPRYGYSSGWRSAARDLATGS